MRKNRFLIAVSLSALVLLALTAGCTEQPPAEPASPNGAGPNTLSGSTVPGGANQPVAGGAQQMMTPGNRPRPR